VNYFLVHRERNERKVFFTAQKLADKNSPKYEKNARNLIQKDTYVKIPTDPKFGRSFDTQVNITLGSV
jgi:hypothetical protein